MLVRHAALLTLVCVLWGVNYVAIDVVLRSIPPVTFSALRFLAVAFPAILFVSRPHITIRQLAIFGLLIFVGQFVFLFCAMQLGLSAGLASLLMQLQVFFTIGLALLFLSERIAWFQVLGASVAFCGLTVIGLNTGGDITTTGLALVLLAALSAAAGNIFTKTLGSKADMLGIIVWASMFAWPALLLLACYVEGWQSLTSSLSNIQLITLLAFAYIVYLSTFFSFTIWGKMLALYPATTIAPFSLLVPVFGMLSASLLLDEIYPLWKLSATLLVLAGLGFSILGAKLKNPVA